MHAFPHNYAVSAHASSAGDVVLQASGLPSIDSQPPAEFGGPGDRWSPESLLIAAVADCFVLSFRAIAGASKLSFDQLNVNADGCLDMVERKMMFTGVKIHASVVVSDANTVDKVERLLHKAEQMCLITNSLNCNVSLSTDVNAV